MRGLVVRSRLRDGRPCGRSSGLPTRAGQSADPRRRRRCGAWSLALPWFARYDGEHPLFKQTRRRAMSLQMRRIDHDTLRFRSFPGKAGEDAVEYPHQAPADEAIVERLVRAIAGWRVLPLKPVADHVDDVFSPGI